ncbi:MULTISPECIES: glycerophosphodiester phosphodiesterase family protein [Subtercola]|uniref:Glycerophosphodiester phosphodiesterase n=1 Tax=Subtercola vilae TaxID=2056433 RepID=A0A4T2C892_9MICO|nr:MULTISPECIES: glycerophosphodiester phosphodiesterase family protein [Subtercola]MEA9983784.1 glycerophosphodiester phosphodiesterase family protein [Subtercola sp. RTI3]TIH40675.1 glycerophosphodiester phosphodiesterase [Subtercola vilae]
MTAVRTRPATSRQPGAFFAPERPRIFAHRGLALDFPENTLDSFRAAVEAGAVYVELDVHASLDGVAVVAHDPSLGRLLGSTDTIAGSPFASLEALDLGAGRGFSRLQDVLQAFPGTRFNIDLKAADAVTPTVEAIRRAGAVDRVLLTSFSEKRRRAAVRQLPGVATSASARLFATALIAAMLGLRPVVRFVLRGVDAVQVPQKALGLTVTAPRVIASIHAAGVEMHVWTINDPAVMTSLLELGVDGLVTDRADIALRLAVERRL